MRILAVCAAAWLALAPVPDGSKLETLHLMATTSVRHARVAPGTRTSLIVEIAPKPKMHVYAPQQDTYVPVSLTLKESRAFRAHVISFPKPVKYFFAPLKETQLVYSEPFKITQDVTLASAVSLRQLGIDPGTTVKIDGTLRYQACDDVICYLPQSLPVSWMIQLEKKG
jgi:DsbC/DsbD-like thiol-disulfide interchange protein